MRQVRLRFVVVVVTCVACCDVCGELASVDGAWPKDRQELGTRFTWSKRMNALDYWRSKRKDSV